MERGRWSDALRRIHLVLALVALAGGVAGTLAEPATVLAQDACTAEVEPNDTPEAASTSSGPVCFEGTLGDGDQDLVLWDLPPAEAAHPWTISVAGVPGTVTGLKILPITSEPGVTPVVAGTTLLEVASQPEALEPTTRSDLLLLPGRYILGISRSATADGAQPPTDEYRFTITPGEPLAASGDLEPNDTVETASPADAAFELSGDLFGSADRYLWTVPEADPGQAWTLQARGVVGSTLYLTLEDADGIGLVTATSDVDGLATLPHLVLAPGPWRISVSGSASVSNPYILKTDLGALEGDPEPNDDDKHAIAIAGPGSLVRGRIGRPGDQDTYRFTIGPEQTDALLDIKLISLVPPPGPYRTLCLQTADRAQLQCTRSDTTMSMPGLLLAPGDYLLVVGGDLTPDGPEGYALRMDLTSAPAPDYEVEPNGVPTMASAFEPSVVMRGRGSPDDSDHFRFIVPGEPQLWEIAATGEAIRGIQWVKRDGTQLSVGDVSLDGASALLTDLYLIPGEHWIRLDAGGAYEIRASPLGPPDPDMEREPNNDATFAEPYPLSREHVVGRLPLVNDTDVFRVSLAGTERLTLRAVPPEDGAIELGVTSGGQQIASTRSPGVGHPTVRELLLGPGDYEVWLRAGYEGVSRDRYELTVERGDPLVTRDDEEPNDDAGHASTLPPTLRIRGEGPPTGDIDWYLLPPVPEGAALTVTVEGAFGHVAVSDGATDVPGAFDPASGILTTDPIFGPGARYLRVQPTGAYTAVVSAPGLVAQEPSAPLAVRLGLTAAVEEVAAWWPSGQRVAGTLSIANEGSATEVLDLDAVTSHFAWSAVPESPRVTVEPGQALEVPVAIVVGADAWADEPVRVTMRARNAAGSSQTGSVVLTPRREVDPVAPEPWWPVPEALLGGLDVASLALGAAPVASIDPTREAQLHDGLTHSGLGLVADPSSLPLTLTVDLAGETPIPIAGVILNPLAGSALPGSVPRAFQLALSIDGVTYEPVLEGEMSTLMGDQAFVLDAPVEAAYAQLRIESDHGGALREVTLGEWKVIAVPGAVPTPGPLNIADPVRGGHVAWMAPQPDVQEFPHGLLTDDGVVQALDLEAGTPIEWAVGFRDDRAAQITSIEWVDPVPSTPDARIRRVEVAISLVGPAGPWERVGTWELERAGDGTVPPFTFEEPAWARFVRFSAAGPKRDIWPFELPAVVRILERATDGEYRSVLAEWGAANRDGPYELLVPPDVSVPPAGSDANDTPETAEALAPETTVAGRVDGTVDVDWYALTIPAGHNTLTLRLAGTPIVATALTLLDADGLRVPTRFEPGSVPGTVEYTAQVAEGSTYSVEVRQPPSSIAFLYDTSLSIWHWYPYIAQSLRAFAADVTPGEEAVKIWPFEEEPVLEEWSDDRYELQNAVDRYLNVGSSSSVEAALIEAIKELSAREGARAILLETDAETTSYGQNTELWRMLESVRPMVFAVHVGAQSYPALSRAWMQDYAQVAGGAYQYASSFGDMSRAFDRLATWLRRPAGYELTMSTAFVEEPPASRKPGAISVVPPPEDPSVAAIGGDVGVEIILDTSGSMLRPAGGRPRIEVAKDVLRDLVEEGLPAGTPVALRILGDRADPCGTRLAVPLGPLDPDTVTRLVDRIEVVSEADTPLGAAIAAVPDDLAASEGTRILLVITDSQEIWPHRDLCGMDPEGAIRRLGRRGIDARLNIVGFGLGDRRAKAQMRRWAREGNGSYFDARNARQLGEAIREAVRAPFRIFDDAGNEVGSGTVGGSPVPVPPGSYDVVVLSDPVARFDAVEVGPDGSVTLTMPIPEPPVPDEPAPDQAAGSTPTP